MTRKVVTWIAVMTTMATLAAPGLFAVEKKAGPVGVPPETVADYLRAVIMAHRHFYTIHIVNRLGQDRIVEASENWQATHSLPLPVQLLQETSEIAELTGAKIIRVFSYWRTTAPDQCVDRIVAALQDLADRAQKRGLIIGLENEHACNVGTGAEAGRVLAALDHPALQSIWDPANASILGETPFPDGYAKLPASRIVHVHAKDCVVKGHKPTSRTGAE